MHTILSSKESNIPKTSCSMPRQESISKSYSVHIKRSECLNIDDCRVPIGSEPSIPRPSGSAGHKIFSMLLDCELVEGDASMIICAACNGMGTSDENGVAPLEKGTLGLLVLFNAAP